MQTTSSPTSATPSSDYKAVPFFGWSVLAVLFVAGSFASREISTEDTKNIFYDYGFAVTTIVWYAVLVGLTFALASRTRGHPRALGLNPFAGAGSASPSASSSACSSSASSWSRSSTEAESRVCPPTNGSPSMRGRFS